MRLGIVAAALLFLSACAASTYQAQIASAWQGKPATTLVQQWGTPEINITSHNGDVLYAYVTKSYQTYPTPAGAPYTISASRGSRPVMVRVQTPDYSGLSDLKCETWFEINKQGRILGAKLEGVNCQEDPVFLKRIATLPQS